MKSIKRAAALLFVLGAVGTGIIVANSDSSPNTNASIDDCAKKRARGRKCDDDDNRNGNQNSNGNRDSNTNSNGNRNTNGNSNRNSNN